MTEIWVASFDIGKKNFSFYIEEFKLDLIDELSNIPYKERYNDNGTVKDIFLPILDKVCVNGKKIILENHDITQNCDSKAYLDPLTFHNMNDLLDNYTEYWDKCDIFVIEKQMSFGKKHNTMALKLGQHCWSYFSFHYGQSKNIVEFPAYYKTQILGSEKDKKETKTGKVSYKAIDKPKRKKWCIAKSLEILEKRNDNNTIKIISKSKKKDDLCDVICQLQAFKVLRFLDNTNIE